MNLTARRKTTRPTPGAACIRWMDDGAKEQWWQGYTTRLTPDEITRIRAGAYHAFRRPQRPEFEGQWLTAGPNLEVHIASVQPQRGKYRCRIDQVRDYRTTTVHMPRYTEDPASMENTLAVMRKTPPEPEGVDAVALSRFAKKADEQRPAQIHEVITR